jgi:putative transposase
MAAGTTPTACVAGTYRFQFDADSRSLVGDFESHISVRPAVDFASQVFPLTKRTVSNVFQVFDHDAPCSDFKRVADQCLGGDVQKHSRNASLVSAHPPEKASGGSSRYGLNGSAGAPDTRTTVIQLTPVVEKWFGVCRIGGDEHSLDAHIHADNAAGALSFWNFHFVCQNQEPLKPDALEFGILPCAFGQRTGFVNGKQFAPEGDAFLDAIEVPFPDDWHCRAIEPGELPPIITFGRLVSRGNGFAQGASQLRGQPEFPKMRVVSFGEPVGVQLARFENDGGEPVSRFDPSKQKSVSLRAAGDFELDGSDAFHYIGYYPFGKTMSTELRRNNHSVTRLVVHLVFVVKYRRDVISETVWTSLRYGFDLAAKRLDLALVELNHDRDHVHAVVEYPPHVSISEIANALKGTSSFVARRDCKREAREKLWGDAFWTPSFFAASTGGAPIDTLKLYVQSQQTKAALKGGVSTQQF